MARTLDDVLASLPKTRQRRVDSRFRELKDEVESLQELRRVTGKVQADIAAALEITQPSVSKIEKQTDMYLSTLRSFVEAIGGELELVVRLPSRPPIRLRSLGEIAPTARTTAAPRTKR
ncbi:transcriptional regulator, XRE family protein [Rhodovulum sp. PH10]|uniref:XRE family transcriptional regulator n=1 Tax=Rhodovulum sp. PH10 TaxID=1187851 RepID=UPI00027C2460|nr:XRE family transcriptional regulator [Rhodovulum sp. PH10]EJW13359.1 transcriptional regulator, XRE family protein [Rhodovulum sp. PH10]